MLFFYSLMILLYVLVIIVLLANTRQGSISNLAYQQVNSAKLLKVICTKHLMHINLNVCFALFVQLYMLWCMLCILNLLNVYQADSFIGVVLINIMAFILIIKRLLILTVANKSVLYL